MVFIKTNTHPALCESFQEKHHESIPQRMLVKKYHNRQNVSLCINSIFHLEAMDIAIKRIQTHYFRLLQWNDINTLFHQETKSLVLKCHGHSFSKGNKYFCK